MSKPVKLTTPRFRIVLGDPEESDSWVELTVQAIGVDMQMAEAQFKRHGWGAFTEQPLRYQALVAWFAARRRGLIADTYEEFEGSYLEVSRLDTEEVDEVTPTRPAPTAG